MGLVGNSYQPSNRLSETLCWNGWRVEERRGEERSWRDDTPLRWFNSMHDGTSIDSLDLFDVNRAATIKVDYRVDLQ